MFVSDLLHGTHGPNVSVVVVVVVVVVQLVVPESCYMPHLLKFAAPVCSPTVLLQPQWEIIRRNGCS
jgi:hypothetical protein